MTSLILSRGYWEKVIRVVIIVCHLFNSADLSGVTALETGQFEPKPGAVGTASVGYAADAWPADIACET